LESVWARTVGSVSEGEGQSAKGRPAVKVGRDAGEDEVSWTRPSRLRLSELQSYISSDASKEKEIAAS
jgi:hypothetical protein